MSKAPIVMLSRLAEDRNAGCLLAGLNHAELDPVADHVAGQDMRLLDARGIPGRNREEVVCELRNFASALAGKGDRGQVEFARGFKG
jgi:hypothetical protein